MPLQPRVSNQELQLHGVRQRPCLRPLGPHLEHLYPGPNTQAWTSRELQFDLIPCRNQDVG